MSSEPIAKAERPIKEGYFTWPSDEPRLIASRCKSCGSYRFPRANYCSNPECRHTDVEETTLSRTGKLFTYTIIHYPPPPPFRYREPFTPYAVGLVQFQEGVGVLGILTGCPLEQIRIGMDVTVVAETQYEDEMGNERLTWKFKPSSCPRR